MTVTVHVMFGPDSTMLTTWYPAPLQAVLSKSCHSFQLLSLTGKYPISQPLFSVIEIEEKVLISGLCFESRHFTAKKF